mmetsp:Transcript_117915/g.234897  ORF Transcript_117915/g.234897 Transcript_117915/m.234897 type:complete len:98 (-) Transcript_117915:61-354(-)
MVSERWHVAQHVCAVKVKRHVLRTICSMAEHTLRSAVLLSLRIDTRVSSSAADTGHHVSHYPPQIDKLFMQQSLVQQRLMLDDRSDDGNVEGFRIHN